MRIDIFGIKNAKKVVYVLDSECEKHIQKLLILDFKGRLHKLELDLKAGIAKVSKGDL